MAGCFGDSPEDKWKEKQTLDHLEDDEEEEDCDPTPWCIGCGSTTKKGCDCGPIADNN